ncbi:hypothetical protein [Reichenbachiella sp. MALMAid0571]|uniref:hypothetical protein n=1 Tax=Reichenbachiella sp. MALMAid0571 TaxID=3143939 RepID=UPI0032DF5C5D
MKKTIINSILLTASLVVLVSFVAMKAAKKEKAGVGVKAPKKAEVLFDGSREMLDDKWTYWEGPRFSSELPLKWKIVKDPVDGGSAVNSNDPAAAGGKYGAADMVTKKKYRDFRLHVVFQKISNRFSIFIFYKNLTTY